MLRKIFPPLVKVKGADEGMVARLEIWRVQRLKWSSYAEPVGMPAVGAGSPAGQRLCCEISHYRHMVLWGTLSQGLHCHGNALLTAGTCPTPTLLTLQEPFHLRSILRKSQQTQDGNHLFEVLHCCLEGNVSSQSHRTAWVGRDLHSSSGPSPLQ